MFANKHAREKESARERERERYVVLPRRTRFPVRIYRAFSYINTNAK